MMYLVPNGYPDNPVKGEEIHIDTENNDILKKYNLPINYSKYVNKKTIPSLIKKIAFDKKVINEGVNIVLIGKNGGFIKKILIRDLKSILNQIK